MAKASGDTGSARQKHKRPAIDMAETSKLEQEIGELADLQRDVLVTRWTKIYRHPPPKGIKRGLMERAIAWHLQAKHSGGISPAVRRQLAATASSLGDRCLNMEPDGSSARDLETVCAPAPSSQLTAGTRLVREWHGKAYHVDVVDEGFVFEAKTYSSLSEIARIITGARWSGPRFFGLRRKA